MNHPPGDNSGGDPSGQHGGAGPGTSTTAGGFVHHRRVAFGDTDMAGIVHFAAFFRYMEEAEHALLRHLGVGVFQPDGDRTLSWPRVSVSCDYQAPARFGDVIDVAVRIDRLGDRSVTYVMTLSVDGRVAGVGRVVAACCAVKDGHLLGAVAIPDPIADLLRPFARS